MTLLLDTSVLIDVLHSKRNRPSQLRELVDFGHNLATSVINIAEVYAGLRQGEEAETEAFLEDLVPYVVDSAVARRAGLLKNAFARKGRTFALPDMVVAATALQHNLTLITDNYKDFQIPELKLHRLA